METSAFKADIEIEELKKKIWTDLKFQHVWDDVKLQWAYGVWYEEDHNFISLQTPALVSEDKLALSKVYISKRHVGYILMICQDV